MEKHLRTKKQKVLQRNLVQNRSVINLGLQMNQMVHLKKIETSCTTTNKNQFIPSHEIVLDPHDTKQNISKVTKNPNFINIENKNLGTI